MTGATDSRRAAQGLFDELAAELVAAGGASSVQIGRRTMREGVGVPLSAAAASQWAELMADAEHYVRELTDRSASSLK